MITDAILNLSRIVFTWTISLLPGSGNLPTWISETAAGIGKVVAGMASWSVWIPWAQLSFIALALFTLWGFSFFTHLSKTLISHIPFIGGN